MLYDLGFWGLGTGGSVFALTYTEAEAIEELLNLR